MKTICFACGADLGDKDSEIFDEDEISHGLCDSCTHDFMAQMGMSIEQYLEEQAGIQEELPIQSPNSGVHAGSQSQAAPIRYTGHLEHFVGSCPDCGSGQLAFEEGCMKCHICGYSECG